MAEVVRNHRTPGGLYGSSGLQRNDSEEEEPWDQQRTPRHSAPSRSTPWTRPDSRSTPARPNLVALDEVEDEEDQEEVMDDGDLPALTTSRRSPAQGGRVVSGQRTTTRPLHPPSAAGMPVTPSPQQQRQFWGQLDLEDEEEQRDQASSSQQQNQHHHAQDEESLPHDEMASRRAAALTKQREIGNVPAQPDEDYDEEEGTESVDRNQHPELGLNESLEADNTFCGQALTVIGDMCGGLMGQTSDTSKRIPPEANSRGPHHDDDDEDRYHTSVQRRLSLREDPDENTAIEVEFVEPTPSKKGSATSSSNSMSPQKKNAYLSLMARKAKEEFEKKKGGRTRSKSADRGSVRANLVPDDDVYNTFNATEKRKFLRLINTGLTPAEASQQVLAERSEQAAEKGRKNAEKRSKKRGKSQDRDKNPVTENQTGSNDDSHGKKNGRASILAFWKKGQASSRSTPADDPTKEESVAAIDKRIVAAMDRAGKVDPTTVAVRKVVERRPVEKEEEEKKVEPTRALPAQVSSEELSIAEQIQKGEKPQVLDATLSETDESEEDPLGFAKSGINYYDAVRKDRSVEMNDTMEQQELQSEKKAIRPARRHLGKPRFTALTERRSKSAPRPQPSAEDLSRYTSRNRLEKDVESSMAGTLVTGGLVASKWSLSESSKPSEYAVLPNYSSKLASSGDSLDLEPVIRSALAESSALKVDMDKYGSGVVDKTASSASVSRSLEFEAKHPISLEDPTEPQPSTALNTESDVATPRIVADSRKVGPNGRAVPSVQETSKDLFSDSIKDVSVITQSTQRDAPIPVNGKTVDYYRNGSIESTNGDRKRLLPPIQAKAAVYDNKKANGIVEEAKDEDYDVSIDTYFNSNDVYSTAASANHDAMSVFSGGSSYTQSSRVRRPGAARERLAKAKRIEQAISRKKGWHESMRAVAESTNRRWDPQAGWVDYEEPEIEVVPEAIPKDKLHVDLDRSFRAKREAALKAKSARHQNGKAIPVPFPSQWEQERKEMLAKESSSINGRVIQAPERAMEVELFPSPAHETLIPETPRGWVESMRAASAKLAQDGKNWDPEHGWRGIEDEAPDGAVEGEMVPDVVDFDLPEDSEGHQDHGQTIETLHSANGQMIEHHQERAVAATRSPQGGPERNEASNAPMEVVSQLSTSAPNELVQSNDDARSATVMIDLNERARILSAPIAMNSSEREKPQLSALEIGGAKREKATTGSTAMDMSEREPRLVIIPKPPKDTDRKLNQWMAKSGQSEKKRTEMSTEDSDKAVASAGAGVGRYMQLGDNGSVRSAINSGTDVETLPMEEPPIVNHEAAAAPRNQRSFTSEEEVDDDNAETIDSGAFPSVNEQRPASAVVDVIREKVGEEDMSLFPREEKTSKVPAVPEERGYGSEQGKLPNSDVGTGKSHTTIRSESRPALAKSDQSVQTSQTSGSRRGSGPVDIDEVDDSWDSDEEERQSDAWDTTSRSGISASTLSLASKKVPKLRRSTRDTSPVGNRKPSKNGANEPLSVREPVRETRSMMASPTQLRTSADLAHEGAREVPPYKLKLGSQPNTPSTAVVKTKLKEWESRGTKQRYREEDGSSASRVDSTPIAAAQWRSFLEKKVRAESDAAGWRHGQEQQGPEKSDRESQRDHQRHLSSKNETSVNLDDDSLFQFSKRGNASVAASSRGTQVVSSLANEDYDLDKEPSEAYGPEPGDRNNFFKRLSECAAPMMATTKSTDSVPSAHLAFLRSNPQTFIPANLCGRNDVIAEEEEDYDEATEASSAVDGDEPRQSVAAKPRSKSAPRPQPKGRMHDVRSTSSSVISEDFGAKTAYLEAIAMKTAVSKPRSSSRRRERSSSGVSVASSSASAHSEKWKAFLERKKVSGEGPSSASEVSKAAEKYAAEKVEEIMSKMSRSYREPDADGESYGSSRMDHVRSSANEARRADSVKAAEDLAAARVEAMMAALSSNRLDEGEI